MSSSTTTCGSRLRSALCGRAPPGRGARPPGARPTSRVAQVGVRRRAGRRGRPRGRRRRSSAARRPRRPRACISPGVPYSGRPPTSDERARRARSPRSSARYGSPSRRAMTSSVGERARRAAGPASSLHPTASAGFDVAMRHELLVGEVPAERLAVVQVGDLQLAEQVLGARRRPVGAEADVAAPRRSPPRRRSWRRRATGSRTATRRPSRPWRPTRANSSLAERGAWMPTSCGREAVVLGEVAVLLRAARRRCPRRGGRGTRCRPPSARAPARSPGSASVRTDWLIVFLPVAERLELDVAHEPALERAVELRRALDRGDAADERLELDPLEHRLAGDLAERGGGLADVGDVLVLARPLVAARVRRVAAGAIHSADAVVGQVVVQVDEARVDRPARCRRPARRRSRRAPALPRSATCAMRPSSPTQTAPSSMTVDASSIVTTLPVNTIPGIPTTDPTQIATVVAMRLWRISVASCRRHRSAPGTTVSRSRRWSPRCRARTSSPPTTSGSSGGRSSTAAGSTAPRGCSSSARTRARARRSRGGSSSASAGQRVQGLVAKLGLHARVRPAQRVRVLGLRPALGRRAPRRRGDRRLPQPLDGRGAARDAGRGGDRVRAVGRRRVPDVARARGRRGRGLLFERLLHPTFPDAAAGDDEDKEGRADQAAARRLERLARPPAPAHRGRGHPAAALRRRVHAAATCRRSRRTTCRRGSRRGCARPMPWASRTGPDAATKRRTITVTIPGTFPVG